ncbi:MAG: MFS transporter [Candidatus Latescibacteria bacterium]|nr:MFS transporter [Candidatus Latescibacterota bacterium]
MKSYESSMTWQRYHTVWVVLLFGWVANYMARIGLSPALTPIREEFRLSYSQAGLLATAFFYAYALMQFPAGHLGDRFGQKRVLVLGAFGWAVATFCTGLSTTYTTLFTARFVTGLFQGCYFSNDRPIIAAVTPKEKMGFGQGVSFTGLGIGMCLGIH